MNRRLPATFEGPAKQKEAILSISMQFCHRYKRVLVGWHCAKVKGRVGLKIENTQE